MASQSELDGVYMGIALLHGGLSKARRAQVGACLVLESSVVIGGVNGLPKALGNELEYLDCSGALVTKKEVIHAEQACLNKACVEGVSTRNAVMYVSHACCPHCSSNMIACGIREVVYLNEYRDMSGISLLKQANIKVRKLEGVWLEKLT